MRYVWFWVAAALVFFPLDFLWLSTAGRSFYAPKLAGLIREQPILWVAALFYVIFLVGLVLFAIAPARSWGEAALWSAAFGFFCYATFDLTSLSALRYPWDVAVVDMVWGTLLSGAAGAGGYLIGTRLAGAFG